MVGKIFPIDFDDSELDAEARRLSERISKSDNTRNAEAIINDSVRFHVTYIELQNRSAQKVTRQMLWLTWGSAGIAVASLIVACLSYKASQSDGKWQDNQLHLLSEISTNLSANGQTHLAQKKLQKKAQ